MEGSIIKKERSYEEAKGARGRKGWVGGSPETVETSWSVLSLRPAVLKILGQQTLPSERRRDEKAPTGSSPTKSTRKKTKKALSSSSEGKTVPLRREL